MLNKIIFITGLTASGKSNLSLWLASKIDAEIINADSRQVYKYLDMGSGKIEIERVKKVKIRSKNFIVSYSKQFNIPHYLISQYHPQKNYSLGKWLNDVDILVNYLYKKNKRVIICGGTILYLKALKEGWILPSVKPDCKLRKELEKWSLERLFNYLNRLDKNSAIRIDRYNKRRLIRAIEIAKYLGNVPKLNKNPKYNLLILVPSFSWNSLEIKIKNRLYKRSFFIIKEIIYLRKIGLSFERIINFGLEYRWFGKLVKEIKMDKVNLNYFLKLKRQKNYLDIFENCYRDIRRFARKQWRELKKIDDVNWVNNKNEVLNLVKNFLSY
ncbi:MAG: hypothetical protein NZ866_02320 [Patescibacteria group bacterium]|nr:hypothetical protein [Patescibacteria group bacterium]